MGLFCGGELKSGVKCIWINVDKVEIEDVGEREGDGGEVVEWVDDGSG